MGTRPTTGQGDAMPKKSAKQMRLFTLWAERKRKRRKHGGPGAQAAQTAKPGACGEPDAEPVQLDLIAHLEKLDGIG